MENKVSVAMITYNSAKYIREQIDTILINLTESDELVISDDGSTDDTIEIINEYIKKDTRLKLVFNAEHGINNNCVNSIKNCTGDIIFLSDDDNVWLENKIKTVLAVFEKEKCILIQHDCKIVDSELNVLNESYFSYYRAKKGIIRNIVRSTYGGSLIAFKKELLRYIVPLPKKIPTYYDDWFGIMAEKHGKVVFLNKVLSLWRRHSGSHSTGFSNKKQKVGFLKKFFERIYVRINKLLWVVFK